MKTAVTFIDLSSAYDTLWRKGLLLKFLRIILSQTLTNLLNNMLSNHQFIIHLNNNTKSKKRTLNNGLPQGSVLAPLLFNLYINDLPKTASKQFIYADDIYLANQDKLDNCTNTLSSNLKTLDKFLIQWRLTPNSSKTETTAFHLNNKMADYNLEITYRGTRLKHVPHPKYLGITLDRTLTFKTHLINVASKIDSRINRI